jgi:hypothetical protein
MPMPRPITAKVFAHFMLFPSPTAQIALPLNWNSPAMTGPETGKQVTSPASQQLSTEEIAMLVEHGKRLMTSGDVAAAGIVLRPAAESNDAAAALILGSAYDPVATTQRARPSG